LRPASPAAATVLAIAALFLVAAVAYVIATAPSAVPRTGISLAQPTGGGQAVVITVKKGDSAGAIGDRLESAHVIDNAASFQRLAKIAGAEKGLAAGDYEFLPDTSILDALTRIKQGLTAVRLVVVPEGLRLEEVANVLEKQGVVRAADFMTAAQTFVAGPGVDPNLLASRPAGFTMEGYLYPATYSFPRNASANDVVLAMVKAMSDRFTPALQADARASGLTIQQVLTLASIIQREAVYPADKPVMASVYLNRMKQGMPLQADPTVQYAIGSVGGNPQKFGYWKRDLTQDDLKLTSPYNTYVKQGLPPGPIAAPDIDSIIAVLHPAQTSYLYFASKPDGTTVYATTFEEHQRNVEKYLRP